MRSAAKLVWISVVLGAACQQPAVPPPQQPAPMAQQQQASPPPAVAYPPSVLTGDGELFCDISSKKNGHQKLKITSGGGIEFDAVVSPIVDGRVIAHGPDKGGAYQFTSHLAGVGQGTLPGVGSFDLDELETKVAVAMEHYKQPGGRGTELSFSSEDMARRGLYVEFAGRGHAANGERFTFRINLGAPTDGKGRVLPVNDNEVSEVAAKVVQIRAPVTTVLITTTLQRGP